jgi:hypothetical protein
VAVFTPDAFASDLRDPTQCWYCVATLKMVEFSRKTFFAAEKQRFVFDRDAFEVEGQIPAPAV